MAKAHCFSLFLDENCKTCLEQSVDLTSVLGIRNVYEL